MPDVRNASPHAARWWLLFGATFFALFAAAALMLLYRTLRPAAPLDDQLLGAVTRGEAEEVRRLIRAGARADATEDDGKPALAVAVRKGHHEVIRALVEHGASPWPGLVEAVVADNLDALKLLLALGALEGGKGREGTHALLEAVAHDRRAAADLLLAAGAEVNRAPGVVSPLHVAAERGSEAWVELFLKHNARVDTLREDGLSVADLAARAGNVKLARRLRDTGAPDSGFLDLTVGLALALEKKHAEAIPHLGRAVQRAVAAKRAEPFEFVLDGWNYEGVGTVTALIWLGECYQKAGRADHAKRVFARALADVRDVTFREGIELLRRSRGKGGGEGQETITLSVRSLEAAARDGRALLQVWRTPLGAAEEEHRPLLTGVIR